MDEAPEAPGLLRLVGVYDATGTLAGGVVSVVRALLLRRPCALTAATHGPFGERPSWRVRRQALPVPFEAYHRDDQPPAVRSAVAGVTPVVVAVTSTGVVPLLGPSELSACGRSGDALAAALDRAVAGAGLAWPGRHPAAPPRPLPPP